MTPDDLARLHAACFPQRPRAWSAQEFADLLRSPGCFPVTRPNSFLLGRIVLDEAELLTLAVAPAARRKGLGRALLREFETLAAARGATRAFLEVASDNPAAHALYLGAGWLVQGVRRDYHAPGLHAQVMTRQLAP